ncbi:MAG: hypothetical protein R3A48_13345 [Polyangiales bacterium]
MRHRPVRTILSTDLLVSQSLAAGLLLAPVASLLLASPISGLAVGGGLGFVIAAVLARRRLAEVSVDDDGVVFDHRGRVVRVPHAQLQQVLAEPVDASGFRGDTEAVRVTLVRAEGRPVRFEVNEFDARTLLPAISAPMVRRWSSALAREETLEFRDPRRFPTGAVLRNLAVSAGALFLLLAAALAHVFDLFLTVGMLGLSFGSALNAMRAARNWLRADRGGGLAVSSQGVLHLEDAPRERAASAAYRAAPTSGPWIPWAALRDVRVEGYGLVLDTEVSPTPIRLSASIEGAAPLEILLRQRCDEARRARYAGAERVRFDAFAPEPQAEASPVGHASEPTRARR